MEGLSHSTYGLLKNTFASLKGKFVQALIGVVAYLAPMALLCLIPYVGWIFSVLLFGHLTIGIISYLSDLLAGKEVKLIEIYQLKKNDAAITFLGAILVLMVILGSVLFIIPGIFVIAYFSMSLYVMQRENSTSVMETLRSSARSMNGHKVDLLSYKVIYYLVLALSVLLFGILILLVDRMSASLPILAVALIILLGIIAFFWLSLVVTVFLTSNELFYRDQMMKPVQVSEPVTEVVEVKNVEPSVSVEPQKPVSKPAAKKPAAKKTTAKKPAAKKPAAKKE